MTQTRYTDKESRATAKQPVFLPRLRTHVQAVKGRERSELRVKTEVTGRFDTKSFRYKSFRYKFTQSSCKQFHVLDLSSSRNDLYRNDRFPKRRVRPRRDAKNTFFSLSLSRHKRKKKKHTHTHKQEKKSTVLHSKLKKLRQDYDQLTASCTTYQQKAFPSL